VSLDDAVIATAILALLAERDADHTICPSEVARKLAPDAWRPLMPAIRRVARALVTDGALELRQRGVPISPEVEPRGPIRLAASRQADASRAAPTPAARPVAHAQKKL
jgi:Protein of unknown function (DUF3253)